MGAGIGVSVGVGIGVSVGVGVGYGVSVGRGVAVGAGRVAVAVAVGAGVGEGGNAVGGQRAPCTVPQPASSDTASRPARATHRFERIRISVHLADSTPDYPNDGASVKLRTARRCAF